jgi:glycosyltransferase involved in cell wall biosynthesis
MKKQKKLIVGVTIPGSVYLMPGQLKYFKELGYKTYLLAPKSHYSVDYCEREGCELLPIKIKRNINVFYDFVSLFQIIFIFLKVRPDIVNLGTPKVSLLGLLAARITGVKRRIYTCRGLRYEHEVGRFKKLLILMEKITVSCAHEVNCISQSVKELGLRDGIFSEAKSSVIHKGSSNGINLTVFDPSKVSDASKQNLRKALGLEGYFVFGFLGRIIDRKGIQELYDAFLELYACNKNIRLLMVGPFEMSQISNKNLVELFHNHEAIICPGRTDEVPLHLSIIDVFVLPAWWEGFGNVLVQAAAMGIPVISTNGTGTVDAVSHGYNGLLIPVKDVDSLVVAMNKLLKDDDLRKELGANGKKWAKNFENQIIWNGINNLYLK